MTLQNARWKLEIWYEIKSFESKARDELLHQFFQVTADLGSSRFGSFQFCYLPNHEEIGTYIKRKLARLCRRVPLYFLSCC